MKEPNLNEDLEQQFNNMKKRLLNEINLPRLIHNLPKYKNYIIYQNTKLLLVIIISGKSDSYCVKLIRNSSLF